MTMVYLRILLLSAAIFASQSSWSVLGMNHDSTPSSASSTLRQNPSRVKPFHTNPYASAKNVAPTLRRRHLNVDTAAGGTSQATTDAPTTTTSTPTPRSENNSTATSDNTEDQTTLTPDGPMDPSSAPSVQDVVGKNVGPLPIYAYVLIGCAAMLMSVVTFYMTRRSATREARDIEDVMREFDSYSMSSTYSSNNGETGGTAV